MKQKPFSKYMLLGIIILLSLYILYTLRFYAVGIIFSFIFAFLFSGLYDRILRRIKKPWIASGIVIAVIGLVLILPSVYLFYAVFSEANSMVRSIDSPTILSWVTEYKAFLEQSLGVSISASEKMSVVQFVSSKVFPLFQNLIPFFFSKISNIGVQVLITAFLVFYILINKKELIRKVREFMPFSAKNTDFILEETARNTRALVIGQGLIALIQGIVGAVGFLIFGIESVFFWGFVMALFSFIPYVGSFLIWCPAGIILLIKGDYFNGLGILLWGFLVVSNIDNLIRPKLVSSLGRIHPLVVLLGVIIGINEFSIAGIVIGPLMISVLVLLAKAFNEEYVTK